MGRGLPSAEGSGAGGLSSPVGIGDGGTGEITEAAARAALLGWVAPPAIGDFAADFGAIDASGTQDGAPYVGRTRGASQRWAGKLLAVADVAWRLEAVIYGDDGVKLCGGALIAMGPSGTVMYSHGRYMDDVASALYGRSLSFCWASATASPTSPTWATGGQYEGHPPIQVPHWFAIERSVGGALSIEVRPPGGVWSVIGTHANDTTAIGLTTGIRYLGWGAYAADSSGSTRIHRAYLASWNLELA